MRHRTNQNEINPATEIIAKIKARRAANAKSYAGHCSHLFVDTISCDRQILDGGCSHESGPNNSTPTAQIIGILTT